MRILLAEDDFASRKFMDKQLSRYGECDVMVDGEEAVDAFLMALEDEEPYDLACLDVMMPVMDGLEATRRIRSMEREDCHTIPIVAMSANAFDDDLKKSVECGMNGHLSKPVEVDKLYSTLNQVLRSGTGFCQL